MRNFIPLFHPPDKVVCWWPVPRELNLPAGKSFGHHQRVVRVASRSQTAVNRRAKNNHHRFYRQREKRADRKEEEKAGRKGHNNGRWSAQLGRRYNHENKGSVSTTMGII